MRRSLLSLPIPEGGRLEMMRPGECKRGFAAFSFGDIGKILVIYRTARKSSLSVFEGHTSIRLDI
jgi:hypothetical protein